MDLSSPTVTHCTTLSSCLRQTAVPGKGFALNRRPCLAVCSESLPDAHFYSITALQTTAQDYRARSPVPCRHLWIGHTPVHLSSPVISCASLLLCSSHLKQRFIMGSHSQACRGSCAATVKHAEGCVQPHQVEVKQRVMCSPLVQPH
jgi:hypothetical protein